ncbi:DUF4231 domain-containing protein [Lachnospiraceae bacterium 46-61]
MMFKHLEENKQSELNYSLELTKQLEEPTKTLVENTFKKNIIAMAKNEKNYYMTRIAELILTSVVIGVNIIPLEFFTVLKIPIILLDARIWTILFSVCVLICIALDSLFQFRDTWQKQNELIQELKNECLKYTCKLGMYTEDISETETKTIFLQRFLELSGEKYSLFEYQKRQQEKVDSKIQEIENIKKEKQEVA